MRTVAAGLGVAAASGEGLGAGVLAVASVAWPAWPGVAACGSVPMTGEGAGAVVGVLAAGAAMP
jgi:hypothetical protein